MSEEVEALRLADEIFRLSSEARGYVARGAHVTPLDKSTTLSRITGAEVYLKLENLQKTGSFKVRGPLFKLGRALEKGSVEGVVAASAGNHAQGVAYAASFYGLKSVIVMPELAPPAKVKATRSYGAEVVLHGRVVDEAFKLAEKIAEERGYMLVHPFDDPEIMAGNGTIAWEAYEQGGKFDTVIVPVGGGGLISGVVSVVRKLMPGVKVIGVEAEAAPKFVESFKEGKPIEVEVTHSLADGLVTKKPGRLTYPIVKHLVDKVVAVDEHEIASAMYLLLERSKILAEGAGAAGVAALLARVVKPKGKTLVIVSGGNADLTSIEKVILVGLAREGRIARITGVIPDIPGQLYKVLEVIAEKRCNVVDIIHDRLHPRISPGMARVTIVLEVPERMLLFELLEDLRDMGYKFVID
ncbi:threonine dehydratase [Aeropyrum pernix K1]|uniref:threonine ammonia-lyase n=1 Tax=Aeropyrum pernix (strain ATCC 700893 / DSM 11879 / JCM 9820 / NBRC 100138 / K1) TaxID=272557 RepID=Q9YBV1_AERPE|nr:threonine ammonia-lyase [Aeropyrum pernix]BAA80497.2 threonine dehydratase [Aeropyrum pernix K1]